MALVLPYSNQDRETAGMSLRGVSGWPQEVGPRSIDSSVRAAHLALQESFRGPVDPVQARQGMVYGVNCGDIDRGSESIKFTYQAIDTCKTCIY